MLLHISHETLFEYGQAVSEIYMEFRLTPITDSSQHVLQHRARVNPARTVRRYVDSLGNTVSYFNILHPQEKVQVTFESVVETYAARFRGPCLAADDRDGPVGHLMLRDMLGPTSLTDWSEEFASFVRPLEVLRGSPVQQAAETIRETIFSSFRYEGEVTSASSPIIDLLREGGGVCQDFAHLMLACCRHLRFPARYVSGYVLPNTPDEEAVASHAWVEVFDPESGWFGMDPTHNRWVEDEYVRVGVGRDYQDVAPNRGVYRGAGNEVVKVSVQIAPLDQAQLEHHARTLQQAGPQAGGYRTRQARKAPPRSILEQTTAAQQQQQ